MSEHAVMPPNYSSMHLDELRQYVLTHREDIDAFHTYVDRSKASGRMITIDPSDPEWERNLEEKLRQVPSDPIQNENG